MYLLIFIMVWLLFVDVTTSIFITIQKKKAELTVLGGTLVRLVIAVVAIVRVANMLYGNK